MSSSEDKWPGEVVRISYQETESGLRLGETQESLATGPLLISSQGDLKEKVDSCKLVGISASDHDAKYFQ